MLAPTKTNMNEKPPPMYYCGSNSPGCLQGSHPSPHSKSVTRKACHYSSSRTCYSHRMITVTNYVHNFVFKLSLYPGIHRYCALF